MRGICRSALLVWSLVTLSVSLFAQAPAEREAIVALRDSLAGVTDSIGLKQLEAATIAIARVDRDNAMLHLRLGFVAYRLGEVTNGKTHFDDAAGEFEWASELHEDWPYSWYGLGLAELALGERASIALENLRQILGMDNLSKAANAFARAAEADPSFAAAAVDLANTALVREVQGRLLVALHAIRLAAASPAGRSPAVQLARGRIERAAGDPDSAIIAFRAALEAGADSGLGLLELARTLYFARRPVEAWPVYFAGAGAAASPQAVALYRADVHWVGTPEEVAAYDALAAPADRSAWLETFWSRRDVTDVRRQGERLAEHYRRWFYAHQTFRLVSRHRHYDITERYRADQSELDDRGVIYMRHGEPDRRASYHAPNVEPNESWLYRRADGDLIFHFVARDDATDYKLVESLVDVLGFAEGTRLAVGGSASTTVAELYGTRQDFAPLYGRVGAGGASTGAVFVEERDRGRRAIAVGTLSDSYRQRFETPLGVVASEFVAGTDPDSQPAQSLHVVFAVPADPLTPQPGPEATLYPLRFRLVVSAGRDEGVAARLDTVRVFATRQPLRDGEFLVGRFALPLPPGRYRYRLLVASLDGHAGDVTLRDSIEVPALDGRSFAAGGLVVGRRGASLVWLQPADTVALNPLDRFPQDGSAEVYYEVYGLARGAPYHTVVRLERLGRRSFLGAIAGLFGGRRAPVLLEFDAPSDGPMTRVHRSVDLRGTAAGAYRLTVQVTDPATHRTVVRSHDFRVMAH